MKEYTILKDNNLVIGVGVSKENKEYHFIGLTIPQYEKPIIITFISKTVYDLIVSQCK